MKDTEELELVDVDLIAEYLEFQVLPSVVATAAQAVGLPTLGKAEWTPTKFSLDLEFPGEIEKIEFIRSNGKKCVIGGEKSPPFYNFLGLDKKNPNPPLVTYDVFDMGSKMMLPKRTPFSAAGPIAATLNSCPHSSSRSLVVSITPLPQR